MSPIDIVKMNINMEQMVGIIFKDKCSMGLFPDHTIRLGTICF